MTWSDERDMGDDAPLLAQGSSSATNDVGGGQTSTRMASVLFLSIEQASQHASCSYMMATRWTVITDIPVKVFVVTH